jgi:hypothetical protein
MPRRAAENMYANISAVQCSEKSGCDQRFSQFSSVRFMRFVSENHKSLIANRSSLKEVRGGGAGEQRKTRQRCDVK